MEEKGYLVTEHIKANRIIYADEAACALTGIAADELLQSDPYKVTEELEVTKIPFDSTHFLWILDTVNNYRQRLTELERSNKALEDALKAAEEANCAKSSFLSNMSHDIRTPMNAIMGMTSIGLAHIDEKLRVQDCLLKIKTASAHLMSLVNDVLDMSRIDSGRMTLNEEEFSIADLIHDIVVIMRPQAMLKNQDLQFDITDIYEENLLGDPLRLRQIIVNIIGNAVKYTQEIGNIKVSFSQYKKDGTQNCKADGEKVWLLFICEDNGMGMSREFLQRIFMPFERVKNSTIGKIEGTGLGMSIVKSLVDSMGGNIEVESEEGKGSKFTVRLPVSVTLQSRESLSLPDGGTVLVAENRDDGYYRIEGYLKSGGLSPVRTSGGMDSVTWLTERLYENNMPCAMLLGQSLSDMPVLELAAHVRQLAGPDFPIILVSEEDWTKVEYSASRAGVNAFVPCPLLKSRLLNTVAGLINSAGVQDGGSNETEDYSRYRILLVEDVEINQEIVTEMLSVTGINVDVANNGAEAVQKFEESSEGYYDIIFMDIQMPIMDGYEATRRIRALSRSDAAEVWIVAMTANAFVEDIRMSRNAGMNEHCSKPVDPDKLCEILKNRFEK